MQKKVLAIAGSALILFSGLQVAAAAEHHHGKVHQHTYSEYREGNASEGPLYGPTAEPEWRRFNGGYSDMAGH